MSATNEVSRANAPTPTLMGIPPEVRLSIYDEVLVSDGPIALSTKANHTEPPILRVSRQVRAEAIGTYYNQNTFHFEVCSWRGARMAIFLQTRAKYAGMHKQDVPTVSLCQGPCRKDPVPLDHLESWLRAVHASPLTFPYQIPVPPRVNGAVLGIQVREVIENAAIGGLHAIAALSSRRWEEVDAIVDALKINIIALEEDRGTVAQAAQRLLAPFMPPPLPPMTPAFLLRAMLLVLRDSAGMIVLMISTHLLDSPGRRELWLEMLAWLLHCGPELALWIDRVLHGIVVVVIIWLYFRAINK